MTSHQLDEERIFHVARGLSDAGLRSEYLDQVCAGDQALRERVEALLAVYEKEQSFLKSAENEIVSTVEHRKTLESPGTTIGRYKLAMYVSFLQISGEIAGSCANEFHVVMHDR